jgi:hypothetical protein
MLQGNLLEVGNSCLQILSLFHRGKKTSQIRQNALESYARAGIVMTNWIGYKHGD